MKTLLSPREAADLLGCSVALTNRWASQGLIAMGPRLKPNSKATLVAESVKMLAKHMEQIKALGKCAEASSVSLAGSKQWNNYITSGQAAGILGVSARTLSLWFDSGMLPGYRLPTAKKKGGDRRIHMAGLHNFAFKNNIILGHDAPRPPRVVWVGDSIPAEISKYTPDSWSIYTMVDLLSLKDQLRLGAYALAIDVSFVGSQAKCEELAAAALDVWKDTAILAVLPEDVPDKVPAWATCSSKSPHERFWKEVMR